MEQIKFKDVAHLYLGCDVNYLTNTGKLFGVHLEYCVMEITNVGMVKIPRKDYNDLKPVLRRFDSMTEREMMQLEAIILKHDPDFDIDIDMRESALEKINQTGIRAISFNEDNNPLMVFEMVALFLRLGFDLFNLIPSGQAIDQSTIKK